MLSYRKTCFVIMPFGEKTDVDGSIVNFDAVYDQLIKPTIDSLDMECVRADLIDGAGFIHRKMFQHVYDADVSVVDITSLNPNVFYELGMRHTVKQCVTVLIQRKGTKIPFNIRQLNVIEYEDISVQEKLDQAKRRIATFITNGLERHGNDSIIHDVVDVRVPAKPKVLSRKEKLRYAVSDANGKFVTLITGDLRNVDEADVWVNSENTNMQMARPFEQTISSLIRYLGARKDGPGHIVKDLIADELAVRMKGKSSVDAGSIVVTGPGELARTNQVKKVFHAAAVVGQVGKGYSPIPSVGMCVTNALECMDSPAMRAAALRSIIFPLIGTGSAGGRRRDNAQELVDAAVTYLRARPNSRVETVYFLAWTQGDLDTWQRTLRDIPGVEFVPDSKKNGKRPAARRTATGSRRVARG